MSNYPPGAANDPHAPWNQPDPDTCRTCEGYGYFWICAECGEGTPKRADTFPVHHLAQHPDPDGDNYVEECPECNGAGECYYDPDDHPDTCRCKHCDPDTYLHGIWEDEA